MSKIIQLSINFKKKKKIQNLYPKFNIPSFYKHKIPYILSETIKKNIKYDFTTHPIFYCDPNNPNKRKINKPKRKSLNALIHAILYHVNIISKQVPVSAGSLTEYCGLSTVSKSGNKSITRGTRALSTLRDMKLVVYERCWDKKSKKFFPSKIKITKKFMELVGICPKKWDKEVKKKMLNCNKNISKIKILINQKSYSKIINNEFKKKFYKYYKFLNKLKKKKRNILKLKNILLKKGENELRHILSKKISTDFLKGKLPNVKEKDLQKIINKKINILKKNNG